VESGNDYVIQLKGKTKKLKEHILNYIEDKKPLSTYKTIDNKKGRVDERKYFVYDLRECKMYGGWEHIHTVTVVCRKGIRKKEDYESTAYYLSNLIKSAKKLGIGIRGHWSVENELHRTKDVDQREDHNYIINYSLARNVSVLQTWALNIIRLFEGPSVRFANEKYANRVRESTELLFRQLRI